MEYKLLILKFENEERLSFTKDQIIIFDYDGKFFKLSLKNVNDKNQFSNGNFFFTGNHRTKEERLLDETSTINGLTIISNKGVSTDIEINWAEVKNITEIKMYSYDYEKGQK